MPRLYGRNSTATIFDGRDHGDDPSWDAAEAESLYAVLESEVIPEF